MRRKAERRFSANLWYLSISFDQLSHGLGIRRLENSNGTTWHKTSLSTRTRTIRRRRNHRSITPMKYALFWKNDNVVISALEQHRTN